MLSRLTRDVAPVMMRMLDLRQRKCFATRAINSSFALPSTGGDMSRATQLPSGVCSSDETLDLGFTRTRMVSAAIVLPAFASAKRDWHVTASRNGALRIARVHEHADLVTTGVTRQVTEGHDGVTARR